MELNRAPAPEQAASTQPPARRCLFRRETFSHIDFHRGEDIAAAYAAQAQYKNFYDKLLDFLLRMQPTPAGMCGGLAAERANFAEAPDKTFVKTRAAARH